MLSLKTIKQFYKSYAIPLTATVLFLAVLAVLLVYRQEQLTSLPNKFTQDAGEEKSETRLISQDEAAEIQTKSNNELAANSSGGDSGSGSSDSNNTGQPTTENSDGGSSGSGSGDGNGDGGGGGGDDDEDEEEETEFSASILGMQHGIKNISYNSKDGTCTVTHRIDAAVRARNGPGEVIYRWKRSNGQQTPEETLQADRGDNSYMISHEWKITSGVNEPPENKWVRFIILEPNSDSQQESFEHECGQTF